MLLSFSAFLVLWSILCILVAQVLNNTFWSGVFWVAFTAVLAVFCNYLKLALRTTLTRSRLWLWGKNKFDSWPEFSRWMQVTDSERMDYLAGIPDESWSPLHEGDAVTHDGY